VLPFVEKGARQFFPSLRRFIRLEVLRLALDVHKKFFQGSLNCRVRLLSLNASEGQRPRRGPGNLRRGQAALVGKEVDSLLEVLLDASGIDPAAPLQLGAENRGL